MSTPLPFALLERIASSDIAQSVLLHAQHLYLSSHRPRSNELLDWETLRNAVKYHIEIGRAHV